MLDKIATLGLIVVFSVSMLFNLLAFSIDQASWKTCATEGYVNATLLAHFYYSVSIKSSQQSENTCTHSFIM